MIFFALYDVLIREFVGGWQSRFKRDGTLLAGFLLACLIGLGGRFRDKAGVIFSFIRLAGIFFLTVAFCSCYTPFDIQPGGNGEEFGDEGIKKGRCADKPCRAERVADLGAVASRAHILFRVLLSADVRHTDRVPGLQGGLWDHRQ
jgi:hypothetical protein